MEDLKAPSCDYVDSIMISEEHREKLLAAARSDEERLLVSLWCYAGMRMREPSLLKWNECRFSEVDGEEVPTAFLVHEYKIVRNGKMRQRITPAFEKVFPHLLRHWKNRDGNSEWIISRPNWRFENRTAFDSLMRRLHILAGLERPRSLFNNLRSTASEECVAAFGSARENEWLGHSEEVRRRHYRPELSTVTATNEALGFLDTMSLQSGAHLEQQQRPTERSAHHPIKREDEAYAAMTVVETNRGSLGESARSSCRTTARHEIPRPAGHSGSGRWTETRSSALG